MAPGAGRMWDGTPPLRVMLVDDHEVVRDGIKALLAAAYLARHTTTPGA